MWQSYTRYPLWDPVIRDIYLLIISYLVLCTHTRILILTLGIFGSYNFMVHAYFARYYGVLCRHN
jgi:hypothetical protein